MDKKTERSLSVCVERVKRETAVSPLFYCYVDDIGRRLARWLDFVPTANLSPREPLVEITSQVRSFDDMAAVVDGMRVMPRAWVEGGDIRFSVMVGTAFRYLSDGSAISSPDQIPLIKMGDVEAMLAMRGEAVRELVLFAMGRADRHLRRMAAQAEEIARECLRDPEEAIAASVTPERMLREQRVFRGPWRR